MTTLKQLQEMQPRTLRLNIETYLSAMIDSAKEPKPIHKRLEEYIAQGSIYIKHLRSLIRTMQKKRTEIMLSSEASAKQFKEDMSRWELAIERIEAGVAACEKRLPEAGKLRDEAHKSILNVVGKRAELKKLLQSYENQARDLARTTQAIQLIANEFSACNRLGHEFVVIDDYRGTKDYDSMAHTCRASDLILTEAVLPDISKEKTYHVFYGAFDVEQ